MEPWVVGQEQEVEVEEALLVERGQNPRWPVCSLRHTGESRSETDSGCCGRGYATERIAGMESWEGRPSMSREGGSAVVGHAHDHHCRHGRKKSQSSRCYVTRRSCSSNVAVKGRCRDFGRQAREYVGPKRLRARLDRALKAVGRLRAWEQASSSPWLMGECLSWVQGQLPI